MKMRAFTDIPRVVFAAPRSGSGKTLVVVAMIQALLDRGLKVRTFKCGPDYIDPMFHQKILGVPSKNLDLFFTDEEKTRELFTRGNDSGISVVEGVMGLYDGLAGTEETASTYHLAKTLRAPIVLVVDTHGMGRSVIAEIKGFLEMDTEHLIAGVILNRMNSMYYQTLRPILEKEIPVPVLGCFPTQKELHLESRHLGLKMPGEVSGIREMAKLAAAKLEETVDVGRILELAAEESRGQQEEPLKPTGSILTNENESRSCGDVIGRHNAERRPVIAVARDEAFCFFYEDNLRLLERLGAELKFFSPVHDSRLPEADGLILYGGYPELYAKELSENTAMRTSVRDAIAGGMPYLAECGGFMYLHNNLIDEGQNVYPMCGVVGGDVSYQGRLVRFGYVALKEKTQHFLNPGEEIRAHEFHYFDSTLNGSDAVAEKPVTGRSWDCAHISENAWAGFAHLYYESNPGFAEHFLNRCSLYRRR